MEGKVTLVKSERRRWGRGVPRWELRLEFGEF
jgi:hypothetical protein